MLSADATVTLFPPAAICAGGAEVLCRGRRAEAGVVAVPQSDVVGAQNAVDGVGEILGLQISELALLLAELEIEQVVVDLRDQSLQRNTALDARRASPAGQRCCADRRIPRSPKAPESPSPQRTATDGRSRGPA